jgi:signal transduction histidine kinase
LCKDFIEKHGGQIWAESEESKGSRFCFTIPNYMGLQSYS